ncbi:ABC transporter ATP-binding protein [Nitratireductor pacificus]|uniref:ABC transporter n=1 Tax=Nitratireductor pacificus pht-3B TaxID=391937 RepID=K2MMQ9_9HYPH|nr:ABC transporter ATP-binding protein [Nitratireductor pacificus]EKF18532.1 ABC transporter [Nitratireductor pacificus pht-3B]
MSLIRHLYTLWPNPVLLLRLGLLQAVMAILQGALLGLLVPILSALLRADPDFAAARPWLIAGALGLLLYGVLSVIASPVGLAASGELAAQLRLHLMRHVSILPLGWFTTERKARLARAVTEDVGHVAHLAVVTGGPAITSLLVSATILVITFFIDWRMGLLFAAIVPFACLALRHSARIADESVILLEVANTEIAGRAIEFGQAQPVLRAAGLGETGSDRMRAALEDHRRVYRHGMDRSMTPDLAYTALVVVGIGAVVVLGAYLLLEGSNSVAVTVALLVLAVRFIEPLGGLIDLNGALREMDNSIKRLMAVLDTPALPQNPNPVRQLTDASIEFSGVSFGYGDKPALSDVTFRCAPGTTTALVGPSGSGKTTVIRLIARFFDVGEGRVSIGGVDVRDLDQEAMMDDIAIIFQEVYLFDDTIENNLRLARPDATADDLAAAAKAARLDELIARLPEGWKTRVGEGGAQLSGGERQRVSIARAFLKKARIVLIDEASSALDPENEQAIAQAIVALSSNAERTVIVIAHRPTTLAAADQVVALDAGRVAEFGATEDLQHAGGFFARLYGQYAQARNWRIAPSTNPN